MPLPAPLCPFLQAPVVAALLPQEQWVPLPVSGWWGAGLGPPWPAPSSEMFNLSSIHGSTCGAHPSVPQLGLLHPQCLNPVGMVWHWALLAPTEWRVGVSGTTLVVLAGGDRAGLEKGASRNLMRSNKCQLRPLGRNKHRQGPPCWKEAWQRRSWWAPQRAAYWAGDLCPLQRGELVCSETPR